MTRKASRTARPQGSRADAGHLRDHRPDVVLLLLPERRLRQRRQRRQEPAPVAPTPLEQVGELRPAGVVGLEADQQRVVGRPAQAHRGVELGQHALLGGALDLFGRVARVQLVELLVGGEQQLGDALVLGELLAVDGDLVRVGAEPRGQVVLGHRVADEAGDALVEGGLIRDQHVGVHELVDDDVGQVANRVIAVEEHRRQHRVVEPTARGVGAHRAHEHVPAVRLERAAQRDRVAPREPAEVREAADDRERPHLRLERQLLARRDEPDHLVALELDVLAIAAAGVEPALARERRDRSDLLEQHPRPLVGARVADDVVDVARRRDQIELPEPGLRDVLDVEARRQQQQREGEAAHRPEDSGPAPGAVGLCSRHGAIGETTRGAGRGGGAARARGGRLQGDQRRRVGRRRPGAAGAGA